jgi:hypothetical protein
MITRDQIVAAARGYLGTPFQDKGRRKGQGMDCVGLILCVCHDLGLDDRHGAPVTANLYHDYSGQPAGMFVQQSVAKHLVAKAVPAMQPGDVVTLALPSAPCHVAFVGARGTQLTLIHAYSGGGAKVMENDITPQWKRRIKGCFSIPGVT